MWFKIWFIVNPREVFKAALLMNSAAIIIAHCHPSGDTTPSREDLNITRQLMDAGKLLDTPILDHIITGTDKETHTSFCSMKAEGLMQ